MSRKPKADRPHSEKRVFLVERQTLAQIAVTGWIDRCAGLKVCGVADGQTQAFRAIKRLHPDLVLTEIMQPEDLSFIQGLHRRHRALPILVFSYRDEEEYAPRALAAGARGFLMKNVDGKTLAAGIRQAMKGRRVLSPAMAARLRR